LNKRIVNEAKVLMEVDCFSHPWFSDLTWSRINHIVIVACREGRSGEVGCLETARGKTAQFRSPSRL
jgi:hypothetical protein